MRDAPIEQVALSGGEPLLRPDLPEIAGDLAGLGLATVTITNGTLLDQARLRRFPAESMFEITLFSADEDLHNRLAGRDVFEGVLENLVGLRRAGHRFVLACVVTRLNWQATGRTIRLGVALGAEAVLLNRINLSRRVFDSDPRLAPTAAQLRWSLRAAEALAAKYGVPIAVAVPVPPCAADPRDYPNLHFGWCPRGARDAYHTISSTGLVRPCNHSSRVLGDLRRQDFAEIVRGPAARAFWKPVPPECRECHHPLKHRCRGGCPAAADECFGDRTRIDPYVELQRRGAPRCEREARSEAESVPAKSQGRSP
jgi:pyrroloquinoline quinone biosynthesis protein E